VPALIVCPACDLVQRDSHIEDSGRIRCARCSSPLRRGQEFSLDAAIALSVSAFCLYVLSNLYPLVSFQVNGNTRPATLLDAAGGLYSQGFVSLSVLVFLTVIVGPLAQIASLLYLLVPLRRGREAAAQRPVFRLLTHVRAWTFVEVFMLGALVAVVRLTQYATVVPGIAIWSLGLLMLSLAALANMTHPEQFWLWVERRRG
jgi:paraquat-inducible protein A